MAINRSKILDQRPTLFFFMLQCLLFSVMPSGPEKINEMKSNEISTCSLVDGAVTSAIFAEFDESPGPTHQTMPAFFFLFVHTKRVKERTVHVSRWKTSATNINSCFASEFELGYRGVTNARTNGTLAPS